MEQQSGLGRLDKVLRPSRACVDLPASLSASRGAALRAGPASVVDGITRARGGDAPGNCRHSAAPRHACRYPGKKLHRMKYRVNKIGHSYSIGTTDRHVKRVTPPFVSEVQN